MRPPSDSEATAPLAALCAGALLAQQVGGKATRDALFLSNFDVTVLPMLIIASSVLSVLVVLVASRGLERLGPGRLVPAVLAASAGLFLLEWGVARVAPRPAALVVYFHVAVLGTLLVSSFWGMVSERFDPRTARRQLGRIAGGGVLGGLAGGVAAERVGSGLGVAAMLPVLALLHAACGLLVRRLQLSAGRAAPAAAVSDGGGGVRAGFQLLGSMPYLRHLALVMLLATTSIVPIDYIFKARASAALTSGEALMRFFAFFYAAAGLLSFAVQAGLVRPVLERLGLARGVGSLPAAVAAGGLGAWLVPGLASAAVARGLEATLRNSLFRSAYEMLYTPIPPSDKRATRALMDVGCKRLGDILGGGLVSALLLVGLRPDSALLLPVGAAIAVAALGLAVRLQRGYVAALEKSLLDQAVHLDPESVGDPLTRSTLVMTMRAIDVRALRAAAGIATPGAAPPAEPLRPGSEHEFAHGVAASEPVARAIADLRSGDAPRVRAVLQGEAPPERALIPHIIPLLAWDEVAEPALQALRRIAAAATGQMLDVLLDAGEPFAVRRRLPRALAAAPTQRAADGLVQGLRDRRFEVRVQCARALVRMRAANPGLDIDRETVLAAVLGEAQVSAQVWQSQRLLDQADDSEGSPFVDALLRDRSSRSLEHVFTLLSLVLPMEPLRIAYRGLHSPDETLRGTALEYLESVLPPAVRDSLWTFLEDRRRRDQAPMPSTQALEALMRSSDSIRISLAELRRLHGEPPPGA